MYQDNPEPGKRPDHLRLVPREPRPWRKAWKEAVERVAQERAA